MKKRTIFPLLLVLCGALMLPGDGGVTQAAKKKKYKSGPVANGGTLKGVITLGGKIPKPGRLKVTKDAGVCGKFLPDQSLLVGRKGQLANAVIEIQGIRKGKKWHLPKTFRYDQKGCAFTPHVMILRPRAKGRVTNSDPIKHNFHTISKRVFNVNKTVGKGKSMKVKKNKIKRAGKIRVKCDLHEWMGGWWIVAKTPYIALSDSKGRFKITNIPPGKYKVRIWQERLGEIVRQVEIKPGGAATLNVAMKKR